ncbi:MAG: hypothetical protein AAFQ09_06965 [Pseudomonadota bacterium]
MIKVAMQIAYRTCTYAVCTFLFTTTGFADAWNTFANRCLAPMEVAADPVSVEMTVIADDEFERVHVLYDDDSALILRTLKGFEPRVPRTCTVAVESEIAWTTLQAGFDTWQQVQLDQGRYEYVGNVAGLNPALEAERMQRYGIFSTDLLGPELRVYLLSPAQNGGIGIASVEDEDVGF